MEPGIIGGDKVIIDPELQWEDIKIHDIIVFRRHGESIPTMHRVIDIREDKVITQGDNSPVSDGLISEHQFVGIVSQITRQGQIVYLRLII